MSLEAEIALTNIGLLVCAAWALGSAFILALGLSLGGFGGLSPDTKSFVQMLTLLSIFITFPSFGAWKFFKKIQRLNSQRRDNFIHKEAFE